MFAAVGRDADVDLRSVIETHGTELLTAGAEMLKLAGLMSLTGQQTKSMRQGWCKSKKGFGMHSLRPGCAILDRAFAGAL
jgi:hypothetical protein